MEVVTYTREGEGGRLKKCLHYPINRMRCWKVGYKVLAVTSCLPPWATSLTYTCTHPHTLTPSHSQEGSHWVSFHFQQSHDELVWVTVVGKAAIFLALCLHSAVDELLRQRSNKPIRKPSENVSKGRTQQEKNSVSCEGKDCV